MASAPHNGGGIPPDAQEIAVTFGSGTIHPLPANFRTGIIAMSILGLLSFISCGLLFVYITYRVFWVRWVSRNDNGPVLQPAEDNMSELALGGAPAPQPPQTPRDASPEGPKAPGSNSFLTLIHNLLVADMVQALSFAISLRWWSVDAIIVPSTTCSAQGFFVNLGGNSIAFFLIAISLNTFFAIVWGFKLSRLGVRILVVLCWVLSFSLCFAGVGLARSLPYDAETGYYARAISLCWVNNRYVGVYGFWFQNFWIVLSIGVTIVCYGWIFVSLMRTKQSSRHMPKSKKHKNAPPEPSGHHPAFLVYPVIYLICAAPICLVGILSLSGVRVSIAYFELVSIISSLAGLLDAILWSSTILFSSTKDLEQLGLAKYQFMRTPERMYGNMIWVEGQGRSEGDEASRTGQRKWWKLTGGDGPNWMRPSPSRASNASDGIHMDTITTVTVDVLHSGKGSKE